MHVRDPLTQPDRAQAAPFARPLFARETATTVHAALKAMWRRATRPVEVAAGEVGQGALEAVEAVVEVLVAALDKPVGVEQYHRVSVEGHQ
nr:hypothetical protein [Blastococcus colisei]